MKCVYGHDIQYNLNDDNIRDIVALWFVKPKRVEELIGVPIERWDVSSVTNMSYLFSQRKEFNADISRWDVSNVTSMEAMFLDAHIFNQPIGCWNTSRVTTMVAMFHSAFEFNQPIGGWDVSNVTSMERMFVATDDFNQNLSEWKTGNVTDMSEMFCEAQSFNQPVDMWDTSKVCTMEGMFWNADMFNQPVQTMVERAGDGCKLYSMVDGGISYLYPVGFLPCDRFLPPRTEPFKLWLEFMGAYLDNNNSCPMPMDFFHDSICKSILMFCYFAK